MRGGVVLVQMLVVEPWLGIMSVILSFLQRKNLGSSDVIIKEELLATFLGLMLAAEKGLLIEIVESEYALLAIREINKKEASLSEWFAIIKDIHYYVEKFKFQHVNRGLIR